MSWEKQVATRLGEVGLRNLVAEFYRRIRQDDVIGPMYPQDDWEGAERRLADFIVDSSQGMEAARDQVRAIIDALVDRASSADES